MKTGTSSLACCHSLAATLKLTLTIEEFFLKRQVLLLATPAKHASAQTPPKLLSHKLSPESNLKVWGNPLLFPSAVTVKAATGGLCESASLTLTE